MTRLHDPVTGRRDFIDDISMPGLLHGTLVRLKVPRARIRKVDASAALRIPGVVRVFTASDLRIGDRVPRFGPVVADQPVLADGQTRYQGEPLALVVAQQEAVARAAAERVEIAFEELSPILGAAAASSNDLLHVPEDRPLEQERWKSSNVMGEWEFAWGSIARGEQQAAIVVENHYSAPFAHHFAIETYGVVCMPGRDEIAVWSPTQHPFILRRVLAQMLGLSEERVKVKSMPMGGSFGSKAYPKVEPLAAVASITLQRPLKVVLNAEEAFGTAQREASQIRIRTGFSREGQIVFQDMEADFLVGAYADISSRVVCKAGLHGLAPYRTPNARVLARGLYTSTPPTTAFRGFGAPHTIMALEGQMNHAAAALGMDPLDIRLANLRQRGERSAYGEKPVDGDWPELLRRVADAIGWRKPKGESIGQGIAFGVKSCIPATRSEARIHLSGAGSAVVHVGTTEMGQGTPTLMASLAARALGLPEEHVTVVAGASDSAPFDDLTASSRSVVHMGNAVVAACDHLKVQLLRLAGLPDDPVKEVRVIGEAVEFGSVRRSLGELLGSPVDGERALVGEGSFESEADATHPLGGPTPFYEAVATAVELTVDAETGVVSVVRVVHGTDAGVVLNPSRAKGLDEGGIVMGLGLALSEQLLHAEDGRLRNGSSLDYRIRTIGDRPLQVESLFLENADGPGPWGAKGLAEGGILAVAPAVCGAIHDCTGVYIHDLPATPEKIWRLAREAK